MTDQPTPEEQAKVIGNRIGLLLHTASLPDDVKQAFVSLIPDMTPEQIDMLIAILEKNVAGAPEIEAREFVKSIELANDAYTKERKDLEAQTMAELDEVEDILNQLEQ
ncbi:hypothetical protein HOI18_04345 [Candidatus Uhrbacteria bacterium]|jgi:hypothetical protein|nr:hypothetical protein [Candidatus Uhrbacteria bacterium]